MSDYKPINCNFYDELEALAVQHKRIKVLYRDKEDVIELNAVPVNFYIRDNAEFMKMENGLEIRLDHLIAVDGKNLKEYQ